MTRPLREGGELGQGEVDLDAERESPGVKWEGVWGLELAT